MKNLKKSVLLLLIGVSSQTYSMQPGEAIALINGMNKQLVSKDPLVNPTILLSNDILRIDLKRLQDGAKNAFAYILSLPDKLKQIAFDYWKAFQVRRAMGSIWNYSVSQVQAPNPNGVGVSPIPADSVIDQSRDMLYYLKSGIDFSLDLINNHRGKILVAYLTYRAIQKVRSYLKTATATEQASSQGQNTIYITINGKNVQTDAAGLTDTIQSALSNGLTLV